MENTLKTIRRANNVTQNELAERANVTRKTIISIENGDTTPSIDLAYRISGVFDMPVEHIFLNKNSAVEPAVKQKIRFIDLFCGIGGFHFAAKKFFDSEEINYECLLSSDIDEFACKSYAANFGKYPSGDITKIPNNKIPEHDILFAGFPCQAFSIIGLGKGFEDTRGTLFFEIARILAAKKPKAFVLENVKRLVSHDGGKTFKKILTTLKDLGYFVDYKVLNALDYGLPQKRERVIIVGALHPFDMKWPKKVASGKKLNDILEKNVAAKYFASKSIIDKRKAAHTSKHTPSIWHENKSGNISSYPYSCALRAGASYNYLLVNGERRLTPREMLRLQGFPDDFRIVLEDSHIRKQAGNAVPVDMVYEVLKNFIPAVFY
ncbi:MAG: DNA (cytosine-5-)-methyltransferase [Elusimicrobia bacterium]|nr:DNA (cytosine-5-)-methyltransferase [Elusimicrobiota bacterium]